jgi:hypothetical protein
VRTHCSDIAFSWLRCWKCGGATIRVRIPVCICIVEGRRRRYAVQAVQHGDVEQRLSTPSGLRLLGASGERAESGGAEGLFLSHSRIRACVPVISRVERGDCADCGGKSNTTRLEPRYATDLGVAGS